MDLNGMTTYVAALSVSTERVTEFAAYCFLFGILASGGSSLWNSALDTLRNVKTTMAKKDS